MKRDLFAQILFGILVFAVLFQIYQVAQGKQCVEYSKNIFGMQGWRCKRYA
jgi:hypothetical protein